VTSVLPLSEALLPPSAEMVPDQVTEANALRDWIWTAMDELTPSLSLVLMLRHFSGVTTYEQIAQACDLPLGTVRSRLNQARSKMAAALLATADHEHDSAEERNRATRREGAGHPGRRGSRAVRRHRRRPVVAAGHAGRARCGRRAGPAPRGDGRRPRGGRPATPAPHDRRRRRRHLGDGPDQTRATIRTTARRPWCGCWRCTADASSD